jgi:arsenate reductase-like glutaredoxin family protein
MASLALVEDKTQEYAAAREELNSLVWLLNEKIKNLKNAELPAIREAAEKTANTKEALHTALTESQSLFVKPKTLVIMGIRVGFAKLKGGLSWDTPEMVIKRIKSRFPDEKERQLYIKTKETPIKKTLEQLPAADLKKLGITVGNTGEAVVIVPTSGEIDKLVDALLNQPVVEELEDEAA